MHTGLVNSSKWETTEPCRGQARSRPSLFPAAGSRGLPSRIVTLGVGACLRTTEEDGWLLPPGRTRLARRFQPLRP